MSEKLTDEEILANLDAEIERLKKSEYLQLSNGWTHSRHYAEGYVAGELATLMNFRRELCESME